MSPDHHIETTTRNAKASRTIRGRHSLAESSSYEANQRQTPDSHPRLPIDRFYGGLGTGRDQGRDSPLSPVSQHPVQRENPINDHHEPFPRSIQHTTRHCLTRYSSPRLLCTSSFGWVLRLQLDALAFGRCTIVPPGTTETTTGNLIHSRIKFDSRNAISRGGFCRVFKGTHRRFGVVALKRLQLPDDIASQSIRLFELEVNTWRLFNHDCILPFLGTYLKTGHLYFVSPWAEYGELPRYLQSNPNANRPKYILQVASALSYIHGKGYIHGDIKGQNILVESHEKVLLCDFGLSRAISAFTLQELRGTRSLRWSSPEFLNNGEGKTPKSDVYAFGMIVYEILSGKVPFHNMGDGDALIAAVTLGRRPPHDPLVDPRNGASYMPVWEVADACWHEEPDSRPDMANAFDHLCAAMQE